MHVCVWGGGGRGEGECEHVCAGGGGGDFVGEGGCECRYGCVGKCG